MIKTQDKLNRFEQRVNEYFLRSQYPPKTAALLWLMICIAEGICFNYILPIFSDTWKTVLTVLFFPVYMISFSLIFWRAADALDENRRHTAHRLIIFFIILFCMGGLALLAGLLGASLYS